ncbi:hypothetical protein N656DRAFT_712942 [Canariomyces notabilis]|uniref:Apple domain-containing protein n=1 Tax=Canariomyces notabilis TaxID=2074819 RepID=A0AAN6QIN6_9PEZI|nr:hypothetical protein N656DRAFT_712942 [Canariomyces arenarius]
MLPRGLLAAERARVNRRQNIAPCPGGDGTTIGTFQNFTVFCNTDLEGNVLTILDAFDFTACVDLCSSHHPKCEGASFDGSRCTLRAPARPEQRRSRRMESAIGFFPGATSNCPTLQGEQQALGTAFTVMCGFVIAGNDISQNFAPTFQDCMGQCASTTGCAAVTFDPSQDQGFKNCYLKTDGIAPSAIVADRRTDTAMVVNGAQVPSEDTDPGVSTVPLPSPSGAPAGSVNDIVFFTPPGGGGAPPDSSAAVAAPESSAAATTTLLATPSAPLVTGAPPSSSPSPGTPPFIFPGVGSPPTSSTVIPGTAGQDAGNTSSSNAWVAAPVVGSISAIALIAVTFVMLRRRLRGGRKGGRPNSAGSWRLPSFLTAWLPGSSSLSRSRGRSTASGRRMVGIGNFSEVNAGQQSAEVQTSVRNSVAGFLTGRPAGMERLEDVEEADSSEEAGRSREKKETPVYEVKKGRVELRSSLNGLGQNRWS